MPDNLGATLADELLKQSERDANLTPIDAVMDAAQSGAFTDDHGFRLLARLCAKSVPSAPSIRMMQDIHHRYEALRMNAPGCSDCLDIARHPAPSKNTS